MATVSFPVRNGVLETDLEIGSFNFTRSGVPVAIGASVWGDVTGTLSDQIDLQTALDAKAAVGEPIAASHASRTDNPHTTTKSQVGLANVDNTSDAAKPVSSATQTALDLKATQADFAGHAARTDNPHTVTKTQVGLSNVDNTSDATKFTNTALTGTPTAPTAVDATSNTQLATTAFVHSLITNLINASPSTLDTLKELADAIGDDPNFATTVATSVATKLAKSSNLSDLTDASAARTNLALVPGTNVVAFGGALGTPTSGTLTNCTFPTLNQNTTGSAASLSISGQTGLLTFTGLASTSRIKTVRDAADTILELGGSYTPTGTWTSLPLTTPKITTGINDANGNSMLAFTATASAVDGFTFTNAATANPATITMAATGSDSNINIALTTKGSSGALIVTGDHAEFNNASTLSSIRVQATSGGNNRLWFGVESTDVYIAAIDSFPMQFRTANTSRWQIGASTGHLSGRNDEQIGWSSSTTPGTNDTAWYRNAAGVIEGNIGTAGQWASLKLGTRNATNNTVTDGLTLGHQLSSGTAAAGLGEGILFNLDSSTTADQNAMRIRTEWTTATHASRTSKYALSLVNNAGALADVWAVAGDGSATLIGGLTVGAIACTTTSTLTGVVGIGAGYQSQAALRVHGGTDMNFWIRNDQSTLYLQAGNDAANASVAMTLDATTFKFVTGGLQLGSPTGGDKGAGSLNAAGDIYKNNGAYTNPDYVFEHWSTGKIEKFIENDGAKEYKGLMSIPDVENYVRTQYCLPHVAEMRKRNGGLFAGGDAILASLEEAYLHIFDLQNQINQLKLHANN